MHGVVHNISIGVMVGRAVSTVVPIKGQVRNDVTTSAKASIPLKASRTTSATEGVAADIRRRRVVKSRMIRDVARIRAQVV